MSSQIPNYIGATAACVTALATGGMFGSNALLSLLNNISSNIASEPVGHFFYNKLSKIRLFKEDPENLNHDLEKAFIGSVKSAILNLQEAYLKKVRINVSKSQYDNEKNKIDTFFKDWLNEFNEEKYEYNPDPHTVRKYLYKENNDAVEFLLKRFERKLGAKRPDFKQFVREKFPEYLKLQFDIKLKEGTEAYNAFGLLFRRETSEKLNKIYSIISETHSTVISIDEKLDKVFEGVKDNQKHNAEVKDEITSLKEEVSKLSLKLPEELTDSIIPSNSNWIKNLSKAIEKHEIKIIDNENYIIGQYGWLIQTYLQKLRTEVGQEIGFRRLSFMTELFQASLKYLCFIQVIQIGNFKRINEHSLIAGLFESKFDNFRDINFVELLEQATRLFENGDPIFMPELNDLVNNFGGSESSLKKAIHYMQSVRTQLINGEINDDQLEEVLTAYLSTMVFWLKKISFLAKYRLVSIKDIQLNYKAGDLKRFVHFYAELHGQYKNFGLDEEQSGGRKSLVDMFTFNKSVLLFKGSNVDYSLTDLNKENIYLSMSPFIIDQSVFKKGDTQTPEIYVFSGKQGSKFKFSYYRNELELNNEFLRFNKYLEVKMEYNDDPEFDDLYENLSEIIRSFKMSGNEA